MMYCYVFTISKMCTEGHQRCTVVCLTVIYKQDVYSRTSRCTVVCFKVTDVYGGTSRCTVVCLQ